MRQIEQIVTAQDCAAVKTLILAFFEWARTLDPNADNAATFKDLHAELESLPGIYGPPDGAFLLARDNGTPVGCVAFRKIDETTAELKRMYVTPDQRGKGTGLALVEALLTQALEMGYTKMTLSSWHTMLGAHKIYRGLGFVDVPQPDGFPPEFHDKVVFMELALLA